MKALRWTAGIAAILTFGLIVLGGIVRRTGSGLSCPDWPSCYGRMILTPGDFAALPDTGYDYWQVMLEWTHRLIAGTILGPLVLLLAIVAVASRKRIRHAGLAALVMLVLLVIQALLGGVTVLDQNSPWSVALHLGNALLLLTTILWLFERSRAPASLEGASPRTTKLAVIAWVMALLAMTSAAVVAKSGAALACSTWPLCDGAWIPALDDSLVRIHFIHRVLAVIVTLAILALFMGTRYGGSSIAHLGTVALCLVVLQVVIGAFIIVYLDPITIAVLHQALGILVFATVTTLVWRSWFAADNLGEDALSSHSGKRHGLALQTG